MPDPEDEAVELRYPLRTAARLTGLSPELIRAWERRYGVVRPIRTPGGTRRYSAADLERLRLVKAAVDSGRRIGQVAALDSAELERLAASGADRPHAQDGLLEEILRAFERMDGAKAQQLISVQLAALGQARFSHELAVPLIAEIGNRWADGRLGIASEHLATGVMRSIFGAALQPSAASLRGPAIVFSTPSGERHELGLLMAALTALGAGANPIYLGPDVPVDDLLMAAERSGAAALALSVVTLGPDEAGRILRAVRDGLPDHVVLLVGGAGARDLDLPTNVEHVEQLDELERRVALLSIDRPAAGAKRQPNRA